MVEQLVIDDVVNTYLPPQSDAPKRVRRTRNIGATLGECIIMTKRSCYPFARRYCLARRSNIHALEHPSFILV